MTDNERIHADVFWKEEDAQKRQKCPYNVIKEGKSFFAQRVQQAVCDKMHAQREHHYH